MKDNINYEAPSDWGVSSEDTWVSFEELRDNGAPTLEGKDVVGFIDFSKVPLSDSTKAEIKEKTDQGIKIPDGARGQARDGRAVIKQGKNWVVDKKLDDLVSSIQNDGGKEKEQTDPRQQEAKPKSKAQAKPQQEQEQEVKEAPKSKKEARPAQKSSKLTGTSSANEQRKEFLEDRGLNPGSFFDQFKDKVSKELGGDPKLSDSANKVVDVIGLFLDGNGKGIFGDVVKEAPDNNPQSRKKFSLEYVINEDGSMTQRDSSAEGEQRGLRNYNELESILEGPVKQALLADGLSEEDLNEHQPEKPGRGATPEQKQKYKKDLEEYQTRERKRNKIADKISSEVIQKHLQKAESERNEGPLDFFKDLSDEEQDQIINAIWPQINKTPLGNRFKKIGSPRKNIFGGYDKDRNPIYAGKVGSIRGKAMLKKYLQQGGVDTYTLDNVLMSPYALTVDHVKPETKGGGDHPDNAAFTRGGLNTQLSDNNFLWLYRQARGEKERLESESSDPEEQKRIYNGAKKAAYTTQFGTSVALSEEGTGANLTTRALQNSFGTLTGDFKKDLEVIASNISEEDAKKLAPGFILDVKSKQVTDFIKKKAPALVGLGYFATRHPNAESKSEKEMSADMKSLLWKGVANKLRQGSTFEEIRSQTEKIKNYLAFGLLPEGSRAAKRYGSKIKANTRPEAFSEGISLLSSFLGRDVQESEIQLIRKQL
tara:strand:- start:2620 stop:4746 length:2127 start_codon:yes stop_codon:yes gene_type:complete